MTARKVIPRPGMGLTRADFCRVFPRLFPPGTCDLVAEGAHCRWTDGRFLAVTLSDEKRRRIATLSIPYHDLTFAFEGFEDGEIELFLKRFDRAFHKGGG